MGASWWQVPGANSTYLYTQWRFYKVVPPFDSVQLVQITPITMVFVSDISTVNGIIQPIHSEIGIDNDS